MSVGRRVYVMCDGPEDGWSTPDETDACMDSTSDEITYTIAEARAVANAWEWTHTADGRDLCPFCATRKKNKERHQWE